MAPAPDPDLSSTSISDAAHPPKPDKAPTNPSPPRRRRIFVAHSIAEAGRSAWLPPVPILLFRLAVSAMLVSHVVFFSLAGDFSFRRYATWNYVGLTVAFISVLTCSLVELLRSDDDSQSDSVDEETGSVPTPVDDGTEVADKGLARAFAQVTVPLYQTFVTASLFGAVVFWAVVYSSENPNMTYPLLSLNAVAPFVALLDVLVSFSMRFRLVYIPLFVLYNSAYAAALYVFFRVSDLYVYIALDPSEQTRMSFILKLVGLGVGTVVAGLILCGLTALSGTSFVKRRAEKVHKKSVEGIDSSYVDSATTSPSDDSSDRPSVVTNSEAKKDEDLGPLKGMNGVVVVSEDKAEVVEDTEDIDQLFGKNFCEKDRKDRSSVPMPSRSSSGNISGVRRRLRNLSGHLSPSPSRGSFGEEDIASSRHSVSQFSVWDDLEADGIQTIQENEYFRMPGAYTGGEDEVVELKPMVRSESSHSGIIRRSTSGIKLSRSSSAGNGFARTVSGSKLAEALASTVFRASRAETSDGNEQRRQSG
eukprot:GFKZ01002085.1.p1 GENE.GFKZ01002085.1~~GFKZ01002085.1.p1  ORF type:complete len:567 (-),score=85.01 GFKZ01002085.1:341-1936(-)